MNTNIKKLIDLHNNLSDKRIIWFPFLFLRPEPKTFITQKRILIMTLFFGSYAGLAYIVRSYFNDTLNLQLALKSLFYGNLAFFIWFQVVTSTLWNIRARELNKGNK